MQVRDDPSPAEPAVLGEIGTAEVPQDQGPVEPEPAPSQGSALSAMPVPAEPAVTAEPRWQQVPAEAAASSSAVGDARVSAPAASALAPPVGGSGEGAAPVARTHFFGVRAKGQRFAFVVDKSASMGNRGRIERAKEELLRSTAGLPDFALFRVCFFDASTESFPEQGYRKARPGDLGQFRAWLGRVVAGGGTMPRVAFERLLTEGAMPDAIFFLTDGEIPPDDPAWIVRRVRSISERVPVHCVALGDESAIPQLKRIAAGTGGQFRYVPGEGTP